MFACCLTINVYNFDVKPRLTVFFQNQDPATEASGAGGVFSGAVLNSIHLMANAVAPRPRESRSETMEEAKSMAKKL